MQPNIEIVAGQSKKSPIADRQAPPRTFMAIGLLSDFVNVATAAALVTLMLRHVWIAPSLRVLALAVVIILTAVVLSAVHIGRSTTALRIGKSVNDNLPPKPMPGAVLADALRRSRS